MKTFFATLCLLTCSLALAVDGVTDVSVKFGSALVLSGPSQNLGIELKKGYDAAITAFNKAGGAHGRKIEVISKDDQYEPRNTALHTTEFLEKDKVFGLMGYVGTPTGQSAIPVIDKNDAPILGLFTGAGIFRDPTNKNIFNVRASYGEETEKLVSHFVDKQGLKKVSLFIQTDAFGGAGKSGVVAALKKRNLEVHSEGGYARNTVDIEEGYKRIKESTPDVVIMVGTYKAFAKLIKMAKADKLTAKFATISFIGTAGLVSELGGEGDGTVISQVVPNPFSSSLEIVKKYQTDMKAAGNTTFDYGSLEGYLYGVLLGKALTAAGKDLTRESFRKALLGLNEDIGGLKVNFASPGNQALKEVYLTEVKGQTVKDL